MVTSRKPKSCHCQSRHCICVVKNAGEMMSSSSSAKVILLKLVQIMEAEFLFFFFSPLSLRPGAGSCPCPLRFLGVLLRSLLCQNQPPPPGMSSPQHLVLEQEQLMKEQELIISNKKSLATRHRLISANQSCFSTRLSKCSCC